jgi:hypothetical protein
VVERKCVGAWVECCGARGLGMLLHDVVLSVAFSSQMFFFLADVLATPSPPINAEVTPQGAFCIDSCCPETAIPKLIFGPDERFGEGIVVMQNNSRLTCMGEFEATDIHITGLNTTVVDLLVENARLTYSCDSVESGR